MTPSLKKPLIYSLIGHLVCLGILSYAPKINFMKPKTHVVWVELPKGASEEIEIKIKESENLPKTTIQEQKEALKEPEPPKEKPMVQPPPKTPPKPALRPVQKETIPKKFKKMSDVEKALAALNKKKPAPPEAAQVKDKGEGFKYGTGTEALKVPPNDPERIAYQAKVRAKILGEWILPPAYILSPNQNTGKISVNINEQGEIISVAWEERSPNDAIDLSCMRAVQRAAPFPPPSPRLAWEAINEGFQIDCNPILKKL